LSLLVWQLVVLALVVGALASSDKPLWRNRGGHFGSFRWWKQNRRGGWWW
jgi:hypothetical protein